MSSTIFPGFPELPVEIFSIPSRIWLTRLGYLEHACVCFEVRNSNEWDQRNSLGTTRPDEADHSGDRVFQLSWWREWWFEAVPDFRRTSAVGCVTLPIMMKLRSRSMEEQLSMAVIFLPLDRYRWYLGYRRRFVLLGRRAKG
jgi:hypothetical protein